MAVLVYTVSRKYISRVLRKNNSKLIILCFRVVEIAQNKWILGGSQSRYFSLSLTEHKVSYPSYRALSPIVSKMNPIYALIDLSFTPVLYGLTIYVHSVKSKGILKKYRFTLLSFTMSAACPHLSQPP